MPQLVEDLDDVECIVDDILVWGETIEQHDKRLRQVLERVRDNKLTLNTSTCEIGVTEIKYIGHTLSHAGLKVDPEKVEALIKMPEPEVKTELQRFMGMLQYVSEFLPNLSTESAPLRELLKKNVLWNWTDTQRQCNNRLKELVASAQLLKYYDAKADVTISVDASSNGLGDVLLQNNQPMAFASKVLTETQKKYSDRERNAQDSIWLY